MLTKLILSIIILASYNTISDTSTNETPVVDVYSKIQKEDLEKVTIKVEPISNIQGFLYYYDEYLEQNINSHMLAINGSMDLDAYKYANDITIQKTTMLLAYVTKDNIEDYSDDFSADAIKLVNDGISLLSEINLMKEKDEREIAGFSKKIKRHRDSLIQLSEKYDAGLDTRSNIDIQIVFNYNLYNSGSN